MSEQIMRAYYAAYNGEDPDRLGALIDDTVVLESAMGTQEGKAAYLATYRFMIGLFVDRMEPVGIEEEGDRVTVHIVDRLTAREDVPDFMGQAVAKGETITLNLTGRYTIRDGRIVRIEIAPTA